MIAPTRLRRAALCAASVAICLGAVLVAAPAQAHTHPAAPPAAHFAATATPHQNTVIGKAMAQWPGGARVSAGEVRWPDGVRLTASATATTGCPSTYYCGCPAGYFCAYPAPFSGSWYEIPNSKLGGEAYFDAWGSCDANAPGCDAGIHSWANNSGFRTWLEQFPDSGNELCITNRTHNLNYNGPDDFDYWIFMSGNPNPC